MLRRELEVIFSLKSMAIRFRIVRLSIALFVGYLLWDTDWFWRVVLGVLSIGSVIHIVHRVKTEGWTQSWGMWKYFPPEW